jgi:ribonuclease HI
MKFIKKEINYGTQYRNDEIGIIVNWYPRKGTVFTQQNKTSLVFPEFARTEKEITDIFNQTNEVKTEIIEQNAICVDCGTHGNPGPSEYKITDINGLELELKALGVHSNNYAELSGIRAALKMADNISIPNVYTDSDVSLLWIKSGKVGVDVLERDEIIKIILDIQNFLKTHKINLKKWDTKRWGEIPADFGRKKAKAK